MKSNTELDIFSFERGDDILAYMHHKLDEHAPAFPFSDADSYRSLFDLDMLIVGKTLLRIDDGGAGGHYLVTAQRNIVIGISAVTHGGVSGKHHIDELVERCPHWEPCSLYFPECGFEYKNFEQMEVFGTLDTLSIICTGPHASEETKAYFQRVSQKVIEKKTK